MRTVCLKEHGSTLFGQSSPGLLSKTDADTTSMRSSTRGTLGTVGTNTRKFPGHDMIVSYITDSIVSKFAICVDGSRSDLASSFSALVRRHGRLTFRTDWLVVFIEPSEPACGTFSPLQRHFTRVFLVTRLRTFFVLLVDTPLISRMVCCEIKV